MIIDLRSDTFTQPTPAMLEAMFHAEVGDDVFGEDPTVNALEAKAAALFGMEAALFCPSGTMTNQIAIKVHTVPGQEVIVEENSHTYKYEGGGIAFNSGCSVKLLKGNRGRLTAAQVEESVNPDDVHFPVSRLVSLENTCNKGGGSCYDFAEIEAIRAVCDRHGLSLHLDGARLFNALAETPQTPQDYGRVFDTISICLSKGLGAPVGSLLLGTREKIKAARRVRKVFGGGMRQAGYLAAAGIYALDHHLGRLKTDHANARTLAGFLGQATWVKEVMPVETNIIIFSVSPDREVKEVLQQLKAHGILAAGFGGDQIRMVTHLGISEEMIGRFGEAVSAI
ncbi:MAG: threonine aldolase [Bacteroidia bacterium]|nr:threonine aldolase [Bacteroidia bacterium]